MKIVLEKNMDPDTLAFVLLKTFPNCKFVIQPGVLNWFNDDKQPALSIADIKDLMQNTSAEGITDNQKISRIEALMLRKMAKEFLNLDASREITEMNEIAAKLDQRRA